VQDPKQVIDILGMWGDAVDNIPGIPGVGEKTAKKLIKEFGSMENVLANAENIKGKVGENIKNNKEQALLSKKLATIILDAPVDVSDEDLLKAGKAVVWAAPHWSGSWFLRRPAHPKDC